MNYRIKTSQVGQASGLGYGYGFLFRALEILPKVYPEGRTMETKEL
jgi:hypothetical protein